MESFYDGHLYALPHFDNPDEYELLQFIHKENVDGVFTTIQDGTTSEEVIEALLDRLGKLNDKFPCEHNVHAMSHLQEALVWLDRRTAERKARGVEGQPRD